MRFIPLTGLGLLIWNSAMIGIGWWLGDQWDAIAHYLHLAGIAGIVLFAAGGAWLLWRVKRHSGGTPERRESKTKALGAGAGAGAEAGDVSRLRRRAAG